MGERRQQLHIDAHGRMFVDGIRVGAVGWKDGDLCLRFDDKNRARSYERGTRHLDVAIRELLDAVKQPKA